MTWMQNPVIVSLKPARIVVYSTGREMLPDIPRSQERQSLVEVHACDHRVKLVYSLLMRKLAGCIDLPIYYK